MKQTKLRILHMSVSCGIHVCMYVCTIHEFPILDVFSMTEFAAPFTICSEISLSSKLIISVGNKYSYTRKGCPILELQK